MDAWGRAQLASKSYNEGLQGFEIIARICGDFCWDLKKPNRKKACFTRVTGDDVNPSVSAKTEPQVIHSLGVFSWCYFLCIYAESSRRLIFGVALSHGEALLDWLIDFVIVDSKKARHVSSVHTGVLRT